MERLNLRFRLTRYKERKTIIQFEVNDMTCGHCVRAVTAAVQEVAAQADISIDLPRHLVGVEGAPDTGAVEQAIRDAGYSPSRKA